MFGLQFKVRSKSSAFVLTLTSRCQAFYFPWVLLAFDLLVGAPVQALLVGIFAGHVYYFFEFVAPTVYHRRVIHTPDFLWASRCFLSSLI